MPMDLKRRAPMDQPKDSGYAIEKVRPDGWPDDEYFVIRAAKDQGLTARAKGKSYVKKTDGKGKETYELDMGIYQTNTVKAHLEGWAVRAPATLPKNELDRVEKKAGAYWWKFTPDNIDDILSGPGDYLAMELDQRSGWLKDVETKVTTVGGEETADFRGSDPVLGQ